MPNEVDFWSPAVLPADRDPIRNPLDGAEDAPEKGEAILAAGFAYSPPTTRDLAVG
jgi:hypothetical protein